MQRPISLRSRPRLLGGAFSVCLLVAACADGTEPSGEAAADAASSSSGAVAVVTVPSTSVTSIVPSSVAETPETTSTTEFVNPFSDAEIAARLLLDPEEYGPDWQLLEFKDYELDESLATLIPGCTTFLESVFGIDDAPNTTAHRYFHAPPGRPAAMGQFVVVFRTEQDAKSAFDALLDPVFINDCIQPYFDSTEFAEDLYCCDPNVTATPPLLGEPIVSDATLHSDDIVFRTDPDQYWTDATGGLHGPEVIDSATVRVGRTIALIETITVDEFGAPFVSTEQFHHAVGTIVDRARHALGGVEH